MPRGDDFRGFGWLLFGIGHEGAEWLDRLRRADWFAGLQPRAEDLACGAHHSGTWAAASGADDADGDALGVHAETFFSAAQLPPAWCAAVAIPSAITPTETASALGLVRALKCRRDPLGRRLDLVVTIDGLPAAGVLAERFRQAGAFVVCGDPSTEARGDDLHHFPLRATIRRAQSGSSAWISRTTC